MPWKVLVLNFSKMRNRFYLYPKSWCKMIFSLTWKYHVYWARKRFCLELFEDWKYGLFYPKSYWLLKSSCFELFEDGNYGLFFIQKVNGRIMVFLLVFLWILQIFLEHLHWLLLQFALLQLAVKMLELYFTLLNFSLPAKPRFKNDQVSRLPTQDPLRSTTKNLFYSAIDSDLVVT